MSWLSSAVRGIFGSTSQSGGQQSTGTSTTTTTPNVPTWQSQPYQQYYQGITQLMNQNQPIAAGPSQLQTQAWNAAGNLGNNQQVNDLISQATDATKQGMQTAQTSPVL